MDRLATWRVGSMAAIAIAAVVYVMLERKYPYTKGQRLFREGFFNDFVLYTLVQSYVLGLVISFVIERLNGGPPEVPRFHLVSGWPLGLQFLFFFVVHDFYIYWFHRAQHHNKYLWRIHEAHHSVKDVDWLAGSRSHSLEILVNQTIEFAPIVLLGASPEIAILKGTVDAVWGMWIHSNIDARTGWLQKIFNGPEMHRWHHAIEITEGGINFGTKLAVWDWIFGTAHLPKEKPRGFGLSDVDFPKNYFVQHAFAFRPFPKEENKRVEERPEAAAE